MTKIAFYFISFYDIFLICDTAIIIILKEKNIFKKFE